jgi:uncharacterized membrane protein
VKPLNLIGDQIINVFFCPTSSKEKNMKKHLEIPNPAPATDTPHHYFRFHLPHIHLGSVFGDDWFSLKAEGFARFFGTPVFLVSQTVIVAIWIGLNACGFTKFDVYPFILLNLAFSLQAAYAAPLILLAQTRQADRDKAHADADAQHREALSIASAQRQEFAVQQNNQLLELLQQNTQLTELVKELSQRIETLAREMHGKVVHGDIQP